MIILGLGTNLGDKLANLRNALAAIKKINGLTVKQVSPVYISDALLPENAPDEWNIPHLNAALRCETSLEPEALLLQLKQIERTMLRDQQAKRWAPRIIDIDILAVDEKTIVTDALSIPHAGLAKRPFALWPLADVAPFWLHPHENKTAAELIEKWGSRFDGHAPLATRQINQRIDTAILVGIINITPDSFSDGGQFLDAEKAAAHAIQLIADGAEIIDIGAESTAPSAAALDQATEWARLQPVLAAILAQKNKFLLTPKISIDTRHVKTASLAIEMDIDWINDVSGLTNPEMREIIAAANKDCVVMHQLSLPASAKHILPRDQDGVALVYEWGKTQLDLLEKNGINRNKIIFDPGIGFGKTKEQSLALIKHADIFKQLSTRVLIGHSRKSFLSQFTNLPANERDIETLALSVFLANQKVDYLRVHDVLMHAHAFRVASATV